MSAGAGRRLTLGGMRALILCVSLLAACGSSTSEVCNGNDCVCTAIEPCSADCSGAEACNVSCSATEPCAVDCSPDAPSCHVECSESTACNVDCAGVEDCHVTCPDGACHVTNCTGPGCIVSCGVVGAGTHDGSTVTCE